ncbi:Hypothetical protein NTJ_04323 [Nesidiocoris tenuis]|uniref:Uncharacterized protein n=1 Tax=Nesidiocoris tenuis TaxID=355587 RepID=A0ABN7AKT4_9HEMI|nr:Hypothetical protein NTJ_04323 [Nesidiocoris tenuis]
MPPLRSVQQQYVKTWPPTKEGQDGVSESTAGSLFRKQTECRAPHGACEKYDDIQLVCCWPGYSSWPMASSRTLEMASRWDPGTSVLRCFPSCLELNWLLTTPSGDNVLWRRIFVHF